MCEKLDRRLLGVAKRYNLRYTRYADDMTFSSSHSVLNIGGEVYKEIIRVIEEQGFVVNSKKTRLQKVGARQEVTGLILSEKINTPRSFVRDLDQILYVWDKFGYEKAYARLLMDNGSKVYHKKTVVSLENVIGGKLDYLKMVKGDKDRVYLKYYSKYDGLRKQRQYPSNGVIYVATYTIKEFQDQFNTTIHFRCDHDNHMASFILNKISYRVRLTSASRKALLRKDGDLSSLYISLCNNGGLFWLIHIKQPVLHNRLKIELPIKKIIEIWENDGIDAAIEAESKYKKKMKDIVIH